MPDPLGPGGWAYWRARSIRANGELKRLRQENKRLQEVVRIFMGAAYPVATEINARGYNWCEPYLDQARENALTKTPLKSQD